MNSHINPPLLRRRSITTFRIALLGLAATLLLGFSSMGGSEWRFTSMIGSAGILTNQNLSRHKTVGPRVEIHPDAPNSTKLDVRYPVTWSDPDYFTTNDDFYWYVRFRDNGSNARVLLKLKSYDMVTGEIQVLATFDSNDYPQSNEYQFESIYMGDSGWGFDWDNFMYYVDARIERSSSAGKPGLAGIVVWSSDVP